MKTLNPILFLSILLCSLSIRIAFATCTGPDFESKNGLCQCKATKRTFHPLIEPNEEILCRYAAALRSICTDQNEFLAHNTFAERCYCKKTRTWLSQPVRYLEDASRAVPTYWINDKKKTLPKDFDEIFAEITSKITGCLETSKAISSYEKQWSPGSFYSFNRETSQVDTAVLYPLYHSLLDQDPGGVTIKSDLKQIVPGKHGGKWVFITLRQGTNQWGDYSDYPDTQGDFHFPMIHLGDTLASFYGFTNKDINTIQAPDIIEVNNATKSINREILSHLKEGDQRTYEETKIPLAFYPVPSGESLAPREYLKNIAFNAGFPVGALEPDDQAMFFHDMGSHVPCGIRIPPELFQFSQEQLKALFDFEEFLLKEVPTVAKNKLTKYMFKQIYLFRTLQWDLGSVATYNDNEMAGVIYKTWQNKTFRVNGVERLAGLPINAVPSTFSPKNITEEILIRFERYLSDEIRSEMRKSWRVFVSSKESDPLFNKALDAGFLKNPIDHYTKRKEFLEEIARKINRR